MQEAGETFNDDFMDFISDADNGKTAGSIKELYPALKHILDEVRREISVQQDGLSSEQLSTVIYRTGSRLGFELSPLERDEIMAHLERDSKPFGILQELVDTPSVTDIIVSGYSKISLQEDRRNYLTPISFPSQSAYEAFVERLLLKAKTSYSTKQPIADGVIDSFARVHAVHKSICEEGPYLTIRINRYHRVNTDHLIDSGFAPAPVISYLSRLITAGKTVLIAGEVGTGKTTLARALSSHINPADSILVIEDTPEIKLDHGHVRYLTTREENAEGAGRFSSSECIRAGMRMAMNRIIFGEIRDAEAAESFIDVCASGHPGLSTIHARSALEAISRLELFLGRAQPGVSRVVITEQIATAIQVVVHLQLCPKTHRRRIYDVREIGPVADGKLRQRAIFTYDTHAENPIWNVANKLSAYRGILEPQVMLHELPSKLELRNIA